MRKPASHKEPMVSIDDRVSVIYLVQLYGSVAIELVVHFPIPIAVFKTEFGIQLREILAASTPLHSWHHLIIELDKPITHFVVGDFEEIAPAANRCVTHINLAYGHVLNP